MTAPRDELVALCEQLRQVFADERKAIGALDHERLGVVAETKRELVGRMSALRESIADPGVRDLLITLRDEARATAMLGITANAAVRALLGYEPSDVYDRRARPITHGPSKVRATY